MAFKVLIPQDITEAGKKYLLERGYEIKMGSGATVDAIKKDVEDCDAILARTAPFPAEVLKAGKKLKVIARHGVGVDNIDVKTAEELGIYVTNAPLSNANSVAEHTIGLIIACARNMVRVDKEFRNGNFEIRNQLKGMDIEGKILGLVGLGRIGTMVAKKAALGLGMKVIGYDPYITQDKVAPEIELINDWEYIFKNADFVSLHMPATEKTKGIVGKKEFEIMKPTAYLINAARGEVVNEAELIEALKTKKIAGAGLDVFEQEPPAKDNPLFELHNVILTPHNAALTQEAMDRMGLHAAIGIDEVLSGKKPSWPVNNPVIKG
ncbi:MAG: D-3-phosphoglycerate dehydrogenase / 2-oxoglutarate reductase [Petroclostridium sp.]|jgi:D-3-phosphoglycerate dehydrogenase|uniref:hydroxyacid dehydrogenase n=1 Tax=Petroclostridium xylanilyticum TaxID=1792311 RepID=UPI000B9834BB|nr:hydroxyacid dehydrogenase [Petroclostridium xylanilyticum]MBZ4646216.1 Phosphoglycerate dehydrogenase [Clostridia bacterium]MDK2811408.1 D-3-phosphoglycerate dehydrogenase / 2-oxoglutarate reductase [Petroclostridium sp.]